MNAFSDADSNDCRSRLIQAASDVIVEEGYRASIDTIATRAGVARQTLYNHFPSKADLFGEVVRQATEALLVTLDGESDSLRERLLRFGLAYRSKVLSIEGLGFFRALVSESMRFPDLVQGFYRSGPGQTSARIESLLGEAIRRGELRHDDTGFMTTMLLSMLVGAERSHYLFSGTPPPGAQPELVAHIIDAFLRTFAPDAPKPDPESPRSTS